MTVLLGLAAAATSWAATPAQPVALDVLLDGSQAVIRGVVLDAQTRQHRSGLATQYRIAVEEWFVGASTPQITIELPGGTLDGLTQRVSGVPSWSEGDDVVVFVPPDGPVSFWGVLTVQGEHLVDPATDRAEAFPSTVAALEEALATPTRHRPPAPARP